jgi:MFS transporter, BCD family, chlorophyll transporter
MAAGRLSWAGIVRLGLVQSALGAIVVLTTSTLNRVMVVELALPATLPGVLIGLHYVLQVLRPRLGHGSDVGGRRTPWIVGGMAVLAAGGTLAAIATAWMATDRLPGIALAVAAYTLIGIGVGAAGTSLLVLLAKRVDPARRAAAATIVWIMMIAGFAITAGTAGHLLDPFSSQRLVTIVAAVSAIAFVVSVFAVWGVEPSEPVGVAQPVEGTVDGHRGSAFRQALAQVWEEPEARRFAVFIFVSMLAYSGQDLILDPFAGTVFGLTPGESTRLAGDQHAGVLVGMVVVALVASGPVRRRAGSLAAWTIGGCLASAAAGIALAASGLVVTGWPLRATVIALGIANGIYAISAVGSMMTMVGQGHASREGVRMGLWGAAQAIAFGLGGLLATMAVDLARYAVGSPVAAYAIVFVGEASLFVVSALLAFRIGRESAARHATSPRKPAVEAFADETAGT